MAKIWLGTYFYCKHHPFPTKPGALPLSLISSKLFNRDLTNFKTTFPTEKIFRLVHGFMWQPFSISYFSCVSGLHPLLLFCYLLFLFFFTLFHFLHHHHHLLHLHCISSSKSVYKRDRGCSDKGVIILCWSPLSLFELKCF